MQYIVSLELAGLYLRTLGLSDRIAVAHRDGRIIDISEGAAWLRVTQNVSLQEAKLLLQNKAVYAEYREDDYKEAAARWFNVLLKYSADIEPSSPSSAFVDLSRHPQPDAIAASLLHELHTQEKLPIKAGIAPAKWLARAAANLCEVEPLRMAILPVEPIRSARSWLAPMSVSSLAPLPLEVRNRMKQLGIRFVRELQDMPQAVLTEQFKKQALLIRAVVDGFYSDPVEPGWPPHSFSCMAMLTECENSLVLDEALRKLSVEAACKLCDEDKVAGGLRLFLLTESNKVLEGLRTFKNPVRAASAIQTQLRQLIQAMDIQEPISQIRITLVELKKSPRRQVAMAFGDENDRSMLGAVLGRIRTAYGQKSVIQASQIEYSREQQVLKAWKDVYGWK